MYKEKSKFKDFGIEEEIDPSIKFNSLLSATVSTIMCLAAKCPLPKSNVETTKLFLSKITDDNGRTPRNVKAFLSLLDDYPGPYDGDTCKGRFEKIPTEKLLKNHSSLENMALVPKASQCKAPGKEATSVDGQALAKRIPRAVFKKSDRDTGERSRKTSKSSGPRMTASRSVISSKL